MITVAAIFHSRNSCKRNKENLGNHSFSCRDPRFVEASDSSNTFQAILDNRLLAINNMISIPDATNAVISSTLSGESLSYLKPNSIIYSVLPVDDNNKGADHNGNQI